MSTDPTFWILARSSGLVAHRFLPPPLPPRAVLAGLVLKAGPLGRSPKPAAITDAHRFLALLGLGAIALHGIALVLDGTGRITPLAVVASGLVPSRPLWTALGVLAAELMVLVYASFS